MTVANIMSLLPFADIPQTSDANSDRSVEDLLLRLRNVRRRLERWMPSCHTMALWCSDYPEIYGAAKRLEATVSRLDDELETCANDPARASTCLRSLLEQLESRASEFEASIVRNAAVA